MTPTIYNFTRALLTPRKLLSTLHDIQVDTDSSGKPRTSRTARFAEVEISWQGSRWLLSMPLTSAAVPDLERTMAHLKTLRSEWLAECLLLRDELLYEDSAGTFHRCDLVLQRLPAGRTFSEALSTEDPGRLLSALDALEAEWTRLDLSHRNLKGENLRWAEGRLIPIRYHYTRKGAGGDTPAFETLRAYLRARSEQSTTLQEAHDVQATYLSGDRFPGHKWVGNIFEQLVCVEDEAGHGYVDTSNRPIIPCQYVWADDFHEGRATVELAEGMGLIDKTGRYVIPPEYEIVEYDCDTGHSRVRKDGRWADFDYEGRQLNDFS